MAEQPRKKRETQSNDAGDSAHLSGTAGWQPGMSAVRSGWPHVVTVLTPAHMLYLPDSRYVDSVVQISHGGDVVWVSVEELLTIEEARQQDQIPPVSLGQGDQRRDLALCGPRGDHAPSAQGDDQDAAQFGPFVLGVFTGFIGIAVLALIF